MFRVCYWQIYHYPAKKALLEKNELKSRITLFLEAFCVHRSIRWWRDEPYDTEITEHDVDFVASMYLEDIVRVITEQ